MILVYGTTILTILIITSIIVLAGMINISVNHVTTSVGNVVYVYIEIKSK